MSFYCAESLMALKGEIDSLYPRRDSSSDGWIGDTSHAARKSDHNPDYSRNGVVRARDFDKDGIPIDKIVAYIVKRGQAGDARLKNGAYLIYNGVIWSAAYGWRGRAYSGPNPHTGHFHLSVTNEKRWYDSVVGWGLKAALTPPKPAVVVAPKVDVPASVTNRTPLIEEGSKWVNAVKEIQTLLGAEDPNGIFGPTLTKLVKEFQARNGLKADGVVGPQTWYRLRAQR